MNVIFFDKQNSVLFTVPNVDVLLCQHNGRSKEWQCIKAGYTEKDKCSRFEIERIEDIQEV